MPLPTISKRAKLVSMPDSRWRDGSGVIHQMTFVMDVGFARPGPRWLTVCGQHNGTTFFQHVKRCPLQVNCVACIGYVPTLPR